MYFETPPVEMALSRDEREKIAEVRELLRKLSDTAVTMGARLRNDLAIEKQATDANRALAKLLYLCL